MAVNTVHKSEKPDSVERILHAATHLFAERGFDGVTTRQIAAAADLNMATMHHHVGTKRQLYERVLVRLFEDERAVIDPFLAQVDDQVLQDPVSLRLLLENLLEMLVDLMDSSPTRARLYMRRWLDDANESTNTHQYETLAFYNSVGELLERAKATGSIYTEVDVTLVLRGFDWLLNGYFVTGPLGKESVRGNPHTPKNLASFKRYLNAYVCSMLGLSPEKH